MIQEEKRVKAQYGLDEILVLKASHGLGEGPLLERKTWDVEKAIKEYQKTLKRDKKED